MQWLISEQAYTKAGLLADVSHDVNELPTLDDMVDIAKWITPERRCCPLFHFRLDLDRKNKIVSLSLRGAEGIKKFIETESILRVLNKSHLVVGTNSSVNRPYHSDTESLDAGRQVSEKKYVQMGYRCLVIQERSQ